LLLQNENQPSGVIQSTQLSAQAISEMYAKVKKSPKLSKTSPIPDTNPTEPDTKPTEEDNKSQAQSSSTNSPTQDLKRNQPERKPHYMTSKDIEGRYSPKQKRQVQDNPHSGSDTSSNRNSPTDSINSTTSSRSLGARVANWSTTSGNRKPSMPERETKEEKGNRRHSWAGDRRNLNGNKPTSLSDFKKLLSQHNPSADPNHRISAKELLQNSSPNNDSQPNGKSSHRGAGGSLRKRASPWKENRFSVIEEEPEIKEGLFNKK
jgi:hypothetical protein